MLMDTPDVDSSGESVFPKPNTPYRIKIKHLFLQPKNQTLVMANYSSNPVQEWYFEKVENTQNQFLIINVGTQDVICAPHLNEGNWAQLKTHPNHKKYNYGFRLKPSVHGNLNQFHITSTIWGQERIWDARNGEAFHQNTVLNWGIPHHQWNQSFSLLEINPEVQLRLRDYIRQQRLCAICLCNEADMINTNCMHASSCEKCSVGAGNRCAICRCEGVLRKIKFC